MFDINGRSCLTVAEAKVGMLVELDGDFTCVHEGAQRVLVEKQGELAFECGDGIHWLAGQESDCDGEPHYIGVYKVGEA